MGLPDDLDHGHIVPLQMRILLENIVHAETVRESWVRGQLEKSSIKTTWAG